MPYGRGGAGNFYQAQEDKKRIAEDLEAARAPLSAAENVPSGAPDDDTPSSGPTSQTQSQEYAHMGRGGAGNWFSPRDLNRTGQFTTTTTNTKGSATTHTPIHQDEQQQQLPTARLGRGGAGNMLWDSYTIDERQKMEKDEEAKREVLSEKVKQDVEAGLAKPGRAVFGEDVGVNGLKAWRK